MDAATRIAFDWHTAGYPDWNALLVGYFLDASRRGSSVERIPATPEELLQAIEDPDANGDAVVSAFVQAVRSELPPGTSFCRYCFRRSTWTSSSDEPPHFFGMLWFTCLLAAGYPEGAGSFRERFRALIGTDDQCRHGRDQRGCLNELWEKLADWTRSHASHAELILPPADDRMVVIGRSYYLAFPTRRDRKVLADVLESEDLLGIEPPIIPVVRAIESARNRFSDDFRAALDHFIDHFLRGGRDPTDSAFWRAIRSEAAYGLFDEVPDSGTGKFGFAAVWDDDETLLLRLTSCESSSPLGTGTETRPLFISLGGATHYITDADGNPDSIVEAALASEIQLPHGLSSLIRQGLLIFVEEIAGEYRLAMGEEIDGAELALVRQDRVDAFNVLFGGATEDSRFDGWLEVSGCRVYQLSQLPAGLLGATQLLHTTSAPRPRLVGGLRVPGGYLWNPFFQPWLRSPAACEVLCNAHGEWVQCPPAEEPGDWTLPSSLDLIPPTSLAIRASFDVDFDGQVLRRQSTTTVRFVERGYGCDYNPPAAGAYWREGCAPEQSEHRGGTPVELEITSSTPSESADLLELDPSARYLGPGLGEMSREPVPNHPWLAIGNRKNPHDLVYVGDLERPILPDGGESADKGDRRVWSYAFRGAGARITARTNAGYLRLDAEPRLQGILAHYRRRASRQSAPRERRVCPPADIGSCFESDMANGVNSTEPAMQAVEVMAALALSRSGIRLREVQELVAGLTRKHDFLLWQQVIRAWADAGVVDLLRRQDRSETLVVPRAPRFVMVRRGPAVEARLIGLAGNDVLAAIHGLAGPAIRWTLASTPFQPALPRLVGLEAQDVEEVSDQIGLAPPQWLWWPAPQQPPGHLKIREDFGGLVHGPPPDAYRFDAKWDWRDMLFRLQPTREAVDLVSVERRRHPQRCSIYVVLVDGEAMAWSHLRSWALLRAAELLESTPFDASADGAIASSGRSPMHLPLAIGRLCSVVGVGLPGPILDGNQQVTGYRYPFGRRVYGLVRTLLPRGWVGEHASKED